MVNRSTLSLSVLSWLLVPTWLLAMLAAASGCESHAMMAVESTGSTPAVASRSQLQSAEPQVPAAQTPTTQSSTTQSPAMEPARPHLVVRTVIYNGSMRLAVDDVPGTLQSIRAIAQQMGGYLHELSAESITVKVPAGQFIATVDAVSELGQVMRREIRGADVTDQLHDLAMRLANAEASRDRLLAMLDDAEGVEDALLIAQELDRVTETIERIKGRIAYLEHHGAYSTLAVHLDTSVPQEELRSNVPFAWVRSLGREIAGQRHHHVRSDRWRSPSIELPRDFVAYYHDGHLVRAMTSDGVLLKYDRHANIDSAQGDFWLGLARRSVAEAASVVVEQERTLTVRGGATAHVLQGTRRIGRHDYGYTLALVADGRHVHAWEIWGPAERLVQTMPAVDAAIGRMNVRP